MFTDFHLVALVIITPPALFIVNRLLRSLGILPLRTTMESDLARMKGVFHEEQLDRFDAVELQGFVTQIPTLESTQGPYETAGLIANQVVYYYKSYSRRANAILLARTSKHEFKYRFRHSSITVMSDGELYGYIDSGGQFLPATQNQNRLINNKDRLKTALLIFSLLKSLNKY